MPHNISRSSIRKRYLVIAIFITFILLICATGAQWYVAYKSKQSNNTLISHHQAQHLIYKIQEALSTSQNIVTEHLLLATPKAITRWNKNIVLVNETINALQNSSWSKEKRHTNDIKSLKLSIQELNRHTLLLLNTRLNNDKQYPALFYARDLMLPQYHKFYTAVNAAIRSLDNTEPGSTQENLLTDLRSNWALMINHFRMYTINRLTSSSVNSLSTQTRDINVYYAEIKKNLKLLTKLQQQDKLGIETNNSLRKMKSSATRWYNYFRIVIAINNSKNWRTDRVIRSQYVQPAYAKVNSQLKLLASQINTTATQNLHSMTSAIDDITLMLWSLTFVGVMLIIMGYYYFDSHILKPVDQITEALHAEAEGESPVNVANTAISETQNLVNAFSYMKGQMHQRHSELEHQAMHDPLTNLPNRYMFEQMLTEFMNQSSNEKPMSLMIMDLNHFKDINDTLGHQAGDIVLSQAGQRINEILRETDVVARLGGDEFAILLPDSNQQHATTLAEKISRSIGTVFNVGDDSLTIGCSIGIAIYPQHASTPEALMNLADMAMYTAKRNNNAFYLYNSAKANEVTSPLKIIDGLHKALVNNDLHLVFQPIIDLNTKHTIGVEALLRWEHGIHGFIDPKNIITIAEHQELIQVLFTKVLDMALQAQNKFNHAIQTPIPITINVSVKNLMTPDFTDSIRRALKKWHISPILLTLDIPHKVILGESRQVFDTIFQLKKIGVQIAIDEFGEGSSSLSILERLPVDYLKIDKQLIKAMIHNDTNSNIIKSSINLAHSMGFKVVAVGIENKQVLDFMQELEPDSIQGRFIGTPMDSATFVKHLLH